MAVSKPAGVPVAQENETEATPSLQTLVSAHLARKGEGTSLIGPRARLVHRLDRDTSGVVLFAKSPRAQAHLAGDLAAARVEKVYLAIVRGTPDPESGIIDRPIGRHTVKRSLRQVDGLDAKEARTRFRVVERFRGGAFSLIEARPITGRTHQIRVHLASIGHPLAVDPLYGGENRAPIASLTRLSLHAASIAFSTPARRVPVTVEAALPDDFRRALDGFRASP